VFFKKTKTAPMITGLRAHKRVITFLLVAFCAFWLTPSWGELGPFYFVLFFAIVVMLIASQLFWIRRVLDLGVRFIPGKRRRTWLAVIASVVYVFFFAYSFTHLGLLHQATMGHVIGAADPSLRGVLIEGVWSVWLVGSWVGFALVMVFWAADGTTRAAAWVYRRADAAGHAATPKPSANALPSPARRRFLEQTAIAASATPFVAAAYGLLFGRLDVEVTRQGIRLARLPKAFEGFRVAQLSDLHISPFMPADEIRRCVMIANGLQPDLVVLTGDYLAWDPAAQGEVVQALAGLHAPYGVFGCLGNHEVITQTEESITRLFAAQGIHILRQERAPIRLGSDTLNLIGIDDSQPDFKGVEHLVMPDTVNILLCHFPDFDRAVELGIDLMLVGHTHGGQLSLEFLHRGLCLSRLETPYVSGWYERASVQLYVNRGIGTTALPIRFGARPEITVFELVRGV
jgi:predicted MPP superfamily phosphohydrolase